MAPKAKAKAKGAAKAKAAPKAMAKVRPRAMRALVGPLRRPAALARGAGEPTVEEKWRKGEAVESEKLHPAELGRGLLLAVDTASYYLNECKVSGRIHGIEVSEGEVYVGLQLLGTTNENLLKQHSGNPVLSFKLHLCKSGCNQQEVSDQLIHGKKVRQILEIDREEGWATNLQKVRPAAEGDELEALRARGQALEEKESDKKKEKDQKSAKEKKRKKAEKERKEKKKERADRSLSSVTSEEVKVDGTMPRQAAKKSADALFRGTGLDARQHVRRKVARRARRALKKRSKKDSSTSGSGSSGSSRGSTAFADDETVFEKASKVKVVATGYPGTLTSQTMSHMRSVLLSEIGTEDKPGMLKACALAYFRQQVAKKASGPAQRELLWLATSIDMILNGNVAGVLDLMTQRFKSCESVLSGCHWSVAQRLELVPPEGVLLTPNEEMVHARKDVYEESRLKWLAAQPEGRVGGASSKGAAKGKTEGKDQNKGGKDRRWSKGGGSKGDAQKRKEDGAGKA
jgi:hypothetical protein